jgi:hypothetical protein
MERQKTQKKRKEKEKEQPRDRHENKEPSHQGTDAGDRAPIPQKCSRLPISASLQAIGKVAERFLSHKKQTNHTDQQTKQTQQTETRPRPTTKTRKTPSAS